MSDSSHPLIELIGADVPPSHGGGGAVVRDVNWTIESGSFWAVGAFAGAGKTDLLLTTAGLQRPARGELLLFGRRIADMNEEELVHNRLKVAMVFGNGRLFSHLTVAENIALPLDYHGASHGGKDPELVGAALALAGISHLADRYPRDVPRSLHQRIALARALALSPEVLLIDNPLGGVDQRSTRWWIDFLCAAHVGDPQIGRRLTIVVATDDLRPWIDTARQFGVLRERRFEAIGGREQVRSTSQAIVRELLTGAFDTV
jgi:ABC-type transporter Mla maintaining outer membrane lipid asymmetry ATPase subunit MlaF